MNRSVWFFVTGVCLLLSSNAFANPFDTLGAGARGSAMGDAAASEATDFSAVYYNPAGLGFGRGARVGLGYVRLNNELWVQDLDSPKQYQDYKDINGVWFGINGMIGSLFGLDGLGAGVLLFSPGKEFVKVEIPQKTYDRFFFKYRNRNQRFVLDAGIAWRITNWLSLGIGVDLLLDLWAETRVYFSHETAFGKKPTEDTANKYYAPDTERGLDVYLNRKLDTRPALTAGVMIQPLDWFRLGVAYRAEQRVPSVGINALELESRFKNRDTGEYEYYYDPLLEDPFSLTCFFAPMQLTVAMSANPLFFWRTKIATLALDVVFERWSNYVDHRSRVPFERLSRGFEDVVSVRTGFEIYEPIWNAIALRAGFRYEPTPAPLPVGEENLIDSDTYVFSVGLGVEFERFWSKLPFELDAVFRYHMLDKISVQKDPDLIPSEQIPPDGKAWVELDEADKPLYNPGFPRYKAGGALWSVGIALTFKFEPSSKQSAPSQEPSKPSVDFEGYAQASVDANGAEVEP